MVKDKEQFSEISSACREVCDRGGSSRTTFSDERCEALSPGGRGKGDYAAKGLRGYDVIKKKKRLFRPSSHKCQDKFLGLHPPNNSTK